MSFKLLHDRVQELSENRFGKPTLVQEKSFQPILEGKHSLVIAPTGTGKSESALLPIFSLFLAEREKKKAEGISILYITPLKALNRDMLERLNWWANHLSIKVDVRHGDTTQYQRSKQTKNPPELLVLTPETLQSILPAKKMGLHLADVKHVVIDEVHELVESKRGTQLSIGLERLVERAGEFQRIGLSATVGSPKETANFLGGNRKVEIIDVAHIRKIEITVESPIPGIEDNARSHKLHLSPDNVARLRRMHKLVDQHTSVLSFVNTRSMAELLSSRYAAIDTKHKVKVHHGSLSKDVRVIAEQDFKSGKTHSLISTSSLELGIDIGRVDLVIQYMSPRQASRLVQRVGRSGHSIYKQPKGIILASDAEDCLEAGVVAARAMAGNLEKIKIHAKAFDVLAHQLVGISLEEGRVSIARALSIVKRAYPFKDLTSQELLTVLRQLAAERYIFLDADSYRRARSALLYYYFNVSMIPDEQKFFVKNIVTRTNVGVLDEAFVAEHLLSGTVFITKGTPWRVLDVVERQVLVEPASDITAAIPDWQGEELPVPFEVAQAVGRARANTKLLKELPLNKDARQKIIKSCAKQKKQGFVPSDKALFIEDHGNFTIVHTHFGSLVNETLGKILAALISSFTGATVGARVDAYRILFDFPLKSQPKLIENYLKTLDPDNLDTILEKTLERSSLFRWKFIHVAKRFGLLERGADYRRVGIRRIISAVVDSPIHQETIRELMTEKLDLPHTKEVLRLIQKKQNKSKNC